MLRGTAEAPAGSPSSSEEKDSGDENDATQEKFQQLDDNLPQTDKPVDNLRAAQETASESIIEPELEAANDNSPTEPLPATGTQADQLGLLQRPVIVAVIAVWMMQMSVDEIVDVIAMRDLLVPASRSVHVGRVVSGARVLRGATVGVDRGNLNHMFIDVITMHVMKVSVVQIVDMIIVADSRMAAIGPMNMRMIAVLGFGATCHVCLRR